MLTTTSHVLKLPFGNLVSIGDLLMKSRINLRRAGVTWCRILRRQAQQTESKAFRKSSLRTIVGSLHLKQKLGKSSTYAKFSEIFLSGMKPD